MTNLWHLALCYSSGVEMGILKSRKAVVMSGVKSETTEAICRRCGLWRRADGNCWRRMEDCPMVEETVAREGQVDE